ncbi:MAG TPA: hypothetical protein PKX74_10680 [Leptospiraceae bacterium]|jgi:hypothetical protein|nr:hypothetical protein [Leptospiraceae bacterium]HMZ35867.1 hypothetical protein [Leptospiraceae bacterium]HNJ03993.1 hypothetical protein [Leptospiraceae bacterium]HNJ32956.1 hypothetical protein [Leptospiraceae bacterium]HQI20100.1 hypothetical protein [Leptospiraceae bacterium]
MRLSSVGATMKIRSFLNIAALSLAFAFSTASLRAEPVVLTEDVLKRYMAIFPSYMRITLELDGTSKMREGAAKEAKVTELIEKRNALLTANGWEDFSEYMEVDARVVRAMTPLGILEKLKNASEPDRKKAEDTVAAQLQDYTPEEIALVKKNLVGLTKMRRDALAGR